jgi:ABC-type multidrug transport system fused ATPase/permease subunit
MEPALSNSVAGRALQLIRRFGAPHRRWFAQGMAATVFVVAARLAMPWPLRGILEIVSNVRPHGAAYWLPEALALAGLYVAIATVLGYVEMTQRVSFKAFAARTVHGMRECAVSQVQKTVPKKGVPELLSRIIGDTARIKAELSGILVHVSQNGLLFAGVVIVFLFLAPKLSVFFLLGGIFAITAGYRATKRISAVTKAQREKESDYALFVNDFLENGSSSVARKEANHASARQDVNATKLIARSAWINHVAIAVITGVALLVAIREAQQGRVTLGEVFLFIAYVLTVHRRMIQVGRQLARSGKLFANVTRIRELTDPENDAGDSAPLPPDAGNREPRGTGSRTAMLYLGAAGGHAHLDAMPAPPGERATLLRSLQLPDNALDDSPDIGFIAMNPRLRTRRIRYFIPDFALLETKEGEKLGLSNLAKRLPAGLKTRISDLTLTRHEAQALAVARLLWIDTGPKAWWIEDPASGLSASKAKRFLKCIFRHAGERTVVITLLSADGIDLTRFDRLVVFDGGHIMFDGNPSGWLKYSVVTAKAGDS